MNYIFTQLVEAMASSLSDAYVTLLAVIISTLTTSTLPTSSEIYNGWLNIGLGGALGLARSIFSVIAIVSAFWIILTIHQRHGKKISRLLVSFLLIITFAVFFYPVYGLLVNASQGLSQGIVNLTLGVENGTIADLTAKLSNDVLPNNPWGRLTVSFFASILGCMLILEAFILKLCLYVALLTYPLAIVLRPLGETLNKLFSVLTSGIIVVVLSPPIMVFGFVLPLVAPLNGEPVFAAIWTILGSLLASVLPVLIFYGLYKGSKEVFGRVEAEITGRVDIASMPNVTPSQMKESVESVQDSAVKTFVSSVASGTVASYSSSDGNRSDFFDKMKSVAIDGIASAATVAGHPGIGVALHTADTVRQRHTSSPEDTKVPSSPTPASNTGPGAVSPQVPNT